MTAHPKSDRLVLPLLILAVITLGLGVFLPVVEVRNLAIFSSRISILEASWELLVDEQYLLGIVVIVFSIVFPFGKILTAFLVWGRYRKTGDVSLAWISRLEFLGRWSCADVLLVAMAIVVAKASGIAGATMEIGMWFFAATIPLTALAVHRVKKTAFAD
jgi:paraquat-inducible protein A